MTNKEFGYRFPKKRNQEGNVVTIADTQEEQLTQLKKALEESDGSGSALNEFNQSAIIDLLQSGGFADMLEEKEIQNLFEEIMGERIISLGEEDTNDSNIGFIKTPKKEFD